ncbi:MAG TPA: hypothetical protein VKA27_00065 [Sunxiuqinia sp.]|nr:hypothetical protein [Sunxiuqinia sp.]
MKRSTLIFLVASILLVLVLVVSVVYELKVLPGQLQRKINGAQLGGFQVRCGDVETNFWARQLIVHQLELSNSSDDAQIQIPYLKVEGISLWALFIQRRIKSDHVFIRHPRISWVKRSKERESPATTGTKRKFGFQTDKLSIDQATCQLFRENSEDTLISAVLNVDVWNLTSRRKNRNYKFRHYAFKRVRVRMSQGKYSLANQLYALLFNGVEYDSKQKLLTMNRIHLVSNYSKYQIGRKQRVETDWLDLQFDGFAMHNIQLNRLLKDTAVVASKADLQNLSVDAFKDRRLPFPRQPNTRLPMEIINELPFKLHCDSFLIHHGTVDYAERVKDSPQAGAVKFTNLTAKIVEISNIKSLIDRPTRMKISTRVMDKGRLTAYFNFPNKQFSEPYQASGELGPMPISAFNAMIEQNAYLHVVRGRVQKISYYFQYNNDRSNGNLQFEYENLKVHLLDHDDHSRKKIKSFLLNSFVVHKDNLRTKNNFRTGTISFQRDKKKSIFNYWWKSVLSGVKSIAIL